VSNIQAFSTYSTSSITLTNTFTTIPGLSLTINLTAPATLYFSSNGTLVQSGNPSGPMQGYLQLYQNGIASLPINQEITYDGTSVGVGVGAIDQYKSWSLLGYAAFTPGTYTFDVKAKVSPVSGVLTTGFVPSSQSALTIQVFY
jgi:hypothetical protein